MEGNLGKVKKFSDDASAYNDCPTWRLGLFALNNTSTNLWLVLLNFVAYYLTGYVGGAVVMATYSWFISYSSWFYTNSNAYI